MKITIFEIYQRRAGPEHSRVVVKHVHPSVPLHRSCDVSLDLRSFANIRLKRQDVTAIAVCLLESRLVLVDDGNFGA